MRLRPSRILPPKSVIGVMSPLALMSAASASNASPSSREAPPPPDGTHIPNERSQYSLHFMASTPAARLSYGFAWPSGRIPAVY